jgi:hypothetical protein
MGVLRPYWATEPLHPTHENKFFKNAMDFERYAWCRNRRITAIHGYFCSSTVILYTYHPLRKSWDKRYI